MFLILFWHEGDARPAVRVVRGTREEAEFLLPMVQGIYGDPDARIVEIHPDHDDASQIKADFGDMFKEV